jgi:hypothetical protein
MKLLRHGDGLRAWELLMGIVLYVVGFWKAKDYIDSTIDAVGIGIASVLGSSNPQQLAMLKAVFESLKLPDAAKTIWPTVYEKPWDQPR